jgi:hypothetical protein
MAAPSGGESASVNIRSMISGDDPKSDPPANRTWLARNWKWCLPVAILLTIGWVWLPRPRLEVHLGYFEQDKRETEQAIAQLHARLGARQFDQIYRDADPMMKNAQSKEALIRAMQETRDKYGEFRQVTNSQMNVIVGNPVQVRAVYNSTFERGKATEMITFIRHGDSLNLAYYSVSAGSVRPTAINSDKVSIATNAAEELYKHVSAREYGAIWDEAHDDLKNSASREQMIASLQQRNQELGACNVPQLINTDLVDNNEGNFVGLIYRRKCDHGEINERLAWKIVDGKALLRGYH